MSPTSHARHTTGRCINHVDTGHVHLVLQPHTLLQAAKGAPLTLSTTHGSPWAYDRYVPILVGGHTVPAQTIARPVGPHQIAPTLSAYVGAKPPSAATDELLVEVLGRPSE